MFRFILRLQHLLNSQERRRFYGLLLLIVFGGLFDAMGVTSILPFMAVVGNPELIQTNPWLHRVFLELHFSSPQTFLVGLGVGALVIMLMSNAVSLVGSTAILWFAGNLGHQLSAQILGTYVQRPYSYFLERNTSHLVMHCTEDVSRLVQGILIPLLQGMAKLIVVTSMLLLVMWIDPWLALLSAAMMGTIYAVVFVSIRGRVSDLGRASKAANRERFRLASEILNGIKELRILGRDEAYRERFAQHSTVFVTGQWMSSALSLLSRYAIETVAFGSMIVLVLYLLTTHQDFRAALPMLTLYALAAYRLLPAFQQIFGSATVIRFNLSALDAVEEELRVGARTQTDPLVPRSPSPRAVGQLQRQIHIENLVYQYPRTTEPILNRLTLTIPRNTTVAIVGSTGSGKTTLIDIILGLLEPQQGSVTVDGAPITSRNVGSWQTHLGYVPQHIYLADDSVAANIAFGVAPQDVDIDHVKHAAHIAHIHDFVSGALPDGYDTVVGERGVRLSGGQRQRLGIARALYSNPDVLILDEATNALDAITETGVTDAIRDLSHTKTIIMIAHRLRTVQQADIIYLLEGGSIRSQGTYEELMATSDLFREMAMAHE